MRVGLTLPSFVNDPEVPLAVARAAEAVGIDGVFVFDHLFRRGPDGARRPALDALTLLGSLATATTTITLGSLVVRASLRPPASLVAAVETLQRLAPGRLLVGVGAGDSESREENESFGLGFGSVEDRIEHLRAAVAALQDRGTPIWVGGQDAAVCEVATDAADGWNGWGNDVEHFRERVRALRAAAVRQPFACTWAGLAVLGRDDEEAQGKARRLGVRPSTIVGGPDEVARRLGQYEEAGADWVIVGPVDSTNPANVAILGQVRRLLG